jgi:hypothetical protein
VDIKQPPQDETSKPLHHEVRDVQVRPIAWTGIGLALLIAVSIAAMRGFFSYMDRQLRLEDVPPSPIMSQRPQQPPEPRLQTTPVLNRKRIFENENQMLNSYGWVDQRAGKVRIPVSLAMKLLAERGLPTRNDQQSATSTQPAAMEGPGGSENMRGTTEQKRGTEQENR